MLCSNEFSVSIFFMPQISCSISVLFATLPQSFLLVFSYLSHRCDHRTQRRGGHRVGGLHHQEAEAGSQRVGQAGHDLQRRVPALLLHTLHSWLRKHQFRWHQHSLHHWVRTNVPVGKNVYRYSEMQRAKVKKYANRVC